MAVNAPYGVLVWMFWCYITEACNYINFNQLNQQENLHILQNCLHYCKMLKKSKLYLIMRNMSMGFMCIGNCMRITKYFYPIFK